MDEERITLTVPQKKSVLQSQGGKKVIKLPEEVTITAKRKGTERREKPTPPPLPIKPIATAKPLPSQRGKKVKSSAQPVRHLNADCSELYNPGHSFPALDPIGERVEGRGPLLRE
jgi:hypothetical protein